VKSAETHYLLDLNAMIALADPEHSHYQAMQNWFDSAGKRDWGVCPLTEAGFIRVSTNPAYRGPNRTIVQAAAILAEFALHPGYRYWPIMQSWSVFTAPFSARIHGHQQVTDACLLGLAIKDDGILVTFDKAIRYLAGTEFSRNLLVLES
jgi:toxin-antitoxin system PIN domain toxin